MSAHRRPPCWRRAPHRPTTTCWPSTSPWVDRASPPPQLRGARWSRRYSTSSRRAPKCELNRPGMSGDSSSWKGWGHVRWFIEEVPAGA
ncbi:hypothetical protein DSI88_18190, partial [Mycobacterium tuberculosis]